MKIEPDEVLEYFLQEARRRFGQHLKQVILFGSRAREEGAPGSDYDLLVILDEVFSDTIDIIDDIAGETLFQYDSLLSIFPVSEEEYNRETSHPFLMNIHKEGIAL